MKKIVIAEKPSVGKDIAKALGCNINHPGYMEGREYIVTWALGHLVTLADPEIYNPNYKVWRLEDLPMTFEKAKFVLLKETRKQYEVVRKQLQRNDVSEVIIATDAGREGELVARLIIIKAGIKKPMKRLWISSITEKAIKDGFKNLKNANEYNNLFNAALARAEADWLVGLNATRALTTKYNSQLSCGRVQSPTLLMIYSRIESIDEFIPKKYYSIQLKTKNITWDYIDPKNRNHIFEEQEVQKVYESINKKELLITNLKTNLKKQKPKGLYDLNELQRDANTMYGFSAKETLNIAQALYERHKVLSYPRTDSHHLSTDMISTFKERLNAISHMYKDAKTCNTSNYYKEIVNNNKVTDHHAIIPTETRVNNSYLNEKEQKIYALVCKRFLSQFLEEYQYETLEIQGEVNNHNFKTSTIKIIKLGWKELYNEEKNVNLNNVHKNEKMLITNKELTTNLTKPKPYLNEATLISAMENPYEFLKNTKYAIPKPTEAVGLGTVATRADIIDKLFNSFLLEKNGNDILLTSKGKQLLNLVPNTLKTPELTVNWEEKLIKISKGNLRKDAFMKEILDYTKKIVLEIKNSDKKFVFDNIAEKKCPKCDSNLLEVATKKGKILTCMSKTCNYKEDIGLFVKHKCPDCNAKLLHDIKKNLYKCSRCSFESPAGGFKQRQEGIKDDLNRGEYLKYKSQNKEVAGDNPFEDLLKMFE